MIHELVARVFAARNAAHLEHWRTKSFAQHEALGAFYADIIGALDDLVECYQGQFDVIGGVPEIETDAGDMIDYLQEEADWIETNRDSISNESEHIANLVDGLVAIYTKTIFKLKRLK